MTARFEEPFALVEASKLLDALNLDDAARGEVKSFLSLVLGQDATVPSVAPGEDEGDVSLYWKTGPMSLEVEVSSDGPHYLWARDETGEIHCIENDRRGIIEQAKNLVLRMGVRARLHNPRWRLQYAGDE
ncbi:MAG: hypothetical protein QM713_07685 [Arachnia sp.]